MIKPVLFIFLCAVFFLGPLAAREARDVTAHFINVGKGDATLLEFPCGAILVDAGGDENSQPALVAHLDAFFNRRGDLNNTLAMVVLTHGHKDHTRNIGAVLDRYDVQTIMLNGHFNKSGYRGLREALRDHASTKIVIADAEHIPDGGLWNKKVDPLDCDTTIAGAFPNITLLWGDARPRLQGWSTNSFKDENNHSVAMMVEWGQSKMLFTGDLETQGLLELLARHAPLLQNVDVYKISHHGFRSGTAPGFLEHINPRVAILSRPADRAWHEPTMKRFEQIVRQTRTPINVKVWTFGAIGDDGNDDSMIQEPAVSGKRNKRSRPEHDAVLNRAVYWTGIDGTIQITMDSQSNIRIGAN